MMLADLKGLIEKWVADFYHLVERLTVVTF